jgi:adenine specific DNA methylase Mod
MCCRKGWEDKSNGCDGTLGIPGEGHVCVAPGSTTVDNACFDTIQGTQFSSKQCTTTEWNNIFDAIVEKKDGCGVSFPTLFRLL